MVQEKKAIPIEQAKHDLGVAEFINQHPSLKGKVHEEETDDGFFPVAFIEDIEETQIDKQKVQDVIDELETKEIEKTASQYIHPNDLKEKLGIKSR